MIRSKYVAFIMLLLLSMSASAQKDTEFWFAAPEVSVHTANFDKPIRFFITTYGQASTVTISQPAGGGMPPQTVNIPANTSQSVDVTAWITSIENTPANTTLNYGIKIEATTPVTIYYEVVSLQCLCNPEIFVLKGANALGTDFFIPSQTIAANNNTYSPQPYSSFDIVATENNTTVTITPSNPIVGHVAGTAFTVILNEGQTYSATATGQSGAQHLQGSIVTSDKPIAVTVKDDLLTGPWGGCADLAGDQIVPVNIVGTEYIAMQGALYNPLDYIYVMATQNNTNISQNGNPVATLNAGQTQQFSLNGPNTYIQASAPVYVLQLSGIGCELSISILPQLVCTGSDRVSFARSSPNDLYVNLMVKNGGQGNFQVNGLPGVITAGQFTAVAGTGGQWYAAQVSLPIGQYPQGSVISVTNTTHLFHLGVLDGSAQSGARFGYFSNYGIVEPVATTTTANVCAGDTVFLFADPIVGATYQWTGPNGFSSTDQNPVIPHSATADSGLYVLTVDVDGCTNTTDITVQVHAKPDVTITTDKDTICGSNVATLTASGADNYTWSPSTGLSSTSGSTVVASPTASTVYTVIGSNAFQCADTASVSIYYGGTVQMSHNIEMCDDSSFMFDNQLIDQAGTYTKTFIGQSGCDSVVTLNVAVKTPPPPVTFNLSDICFGSEVTVMASVTGNYSYDWNMGNAIVASGSNAGPYTMEWTETGTKVVSLTITNECGSSSFTDSLHVNAIPVAHIDDITVSGLCGGDSIRITATSGAGYKYSWSEMGQLVGDDDHYVEFIPNGGFVKLDVTTPEGCSASDSVFVNVDQCCIAALPTAFTPNGDGRNDIYRIITLGNNELLSFSIANRFGEMVFDTKDTRKGWDGTYKGRLADVGVYIYYVKFKCHDGSTGEIKGDVTLIR